MDLKSSLGTGNALIQWWGYVETKLQRRPDLADGIQPKLIRDPENGLKTVKFSLVENIAPELGNLGMLVGAGRPHIYVEGTRRIEGNVPFGSIFEEKDDEFPIFPADPRGRLQGYLRTERITTGRFFLHVYSSNDLQVRGGYGEATTREVLLFSTSEYLGGVVMTMDPDGSRIERPTIEQLQLIQRCFVEAREKIE